MSKRNRDAEEGAKPPKRLRPETAHQQQPKIEEIHFARQLREILAFRQDGIEQLRGGIASFKAFLERILYRHREDEDDDGAAQHRRLAILHEFLDGQKQAADAERPFLAPLWQAWSFAAQNNIDPLSSALSALFALLLRTLSSILDLRDHGYLLCRTALLHQHLRLVRRGLDAPRHKEFLISPCIRLLTEITSFDGGTLARDVYKRREQTFDVAVLKRHLGMVKTDISDEDAKRRPAIRTLTLRYVLAHLKYLHEGGKVDILRSRPLCSSIFGHLRDDPAEVVVEILSVTEQSVLKDDQVPRSAKATLLLQQNLERIAEIATRFRKDENASEKAFSWLMAVITSPSYGLLRPNGWYPPGTAALDYIPDAWETIDLGLDSLEFYDRLDRPEVRSTGLLQWMLSLRPHADEQDRRLALACFTSAPELVAAYFSEKPLQMDPKLSNTWIGHASFIFETIALPVPQYFGNEHGWASLPPQTNIMIENLLPRPLTQKIITRCLNQSSDLVTFFALRLLIVSFEKLSEILSQLRKASEALQDSAYLWHESSQRLMEHFVDRCPRIRDVIAVFRQIPQDSEHVLLHEAVTRLLKLYYQILPVQAMEEQFDISASLTTSLTGNQRRDAIEGMDVVSIIELENLLQIAQSSPTMKWFSRQGAVKHSPAITLLQLHTRDTQNRRIRELLMHILTVTNILSGEAALDALVASLVDVTSASADDGIWDFLDECLARSHRAPVKYVDDLEALAMQTETPKQSEQSLHGLPSLLAGVILEQAPFVAGKAGKPATMRWVNAFVATLEKVEQEQGLIIPALRAKIAQTPGWQATKPNPAAVEASLAEVRLIEPEVASKETQKPSAEQGSVGILFSEPQRESESHPELLKWAQKDLDMALDDGDIEKLILCLCSQYPEIRRQALVQLHKFEDELHSSTLEDKDHIYVLLGELTETYERFQATQDEQLPYIAGTFATHALRVQMDSTHFLYPKINRFLNKGPEWRIFQLPASWFRDTVLSTSEEDDGYWKETRWVVEWLVDGLRSANDLEILRRGGSFEMLMSLYHSPGAAVHKELRERILELIWRCTFIDGGSTTLITRTGVLSWLQLVKRSDGGLEDALRRRILDTCDRAKVEQWSGVAIDEL